MSHVGWLEVGERYDFFFIRKLKYRRPHAWYKCGSTLMGKIFGRKIRERIDG